jgi:hypothetical protein
MNDVVKTCGQCGASKSVSEFHKDKTKKFGVGNTCKVCAKSISKDYYYKNSEHIKRRVTCYSESYVPRYNREIDSRLKNLCTKAKGRTKEFSLVDQDVLDLWEKQNGQCAYTKLPLLATANQFNTVSLDRVDSSKGYVVGNVQLVCAAINKMKQEYTEELFVLLSHLVTQNNKLSETPEVLLARYFPLGTSEE